METQRTCIVKTLLKETPQSWMSYTLDLKTLLGSWTQSESACVLGWGWFPHKPSNSLASAGCLEIQLNSDAIYLDTPTSYYRPAGYRSEVPAISFLVLIHSLGLFTELRNTFYLPDYRFIIIGYNVYC